MAVRKFLAALTLLYAFIGCLLLSGCSDGGAPVTAETSKFKPVDSTNKEPREDETASAPALPSVRTELPGVSPGVTNPPTTPAPRQPVTAADPGNDSAVAPNTPPADSRAPKQTEVVVTPEINKAFQLIQQLKEAEPQGNTRDEQILSMILGRRKVVEVATSVLSAQADPRVHQAALQEAQVALGQLAQLGDPSVSTRMTLFAQALTKHPSPPVARQGRLLTFRAEFLETLQTNEKIDTAALLARLKDLLDKDGGDVDAFSVATSVCQVLSDRGDLEAAADAMRMIAVAFKDSEDKELAQAAKSLPDSAKIIELNLPQQLSDVLDKKDGAETKLLAGLESLFQEKNPNPIFVSPIMEVLRPLESVGNTALVNKLLTMLETHYTSHENADFAKMVNDQIVVPSRKRYGVVGQPFAPEAVSADGQPIDLKPYAGKVVLVSLWGPHQPTSLQEIPVLRKLHEDLGDKGFAVLGLNLDPELKRVEQFMSYQGGSIPYANFHSPDIVRGEKLKDWHDSVLAKQFGLQSLPIYLLVGKDGKVDSLHHFKLDPERLGGRLKELLGLAEIPVFAVKPKPMVIENPTLPKATPLPTEAPPPAAAPKPEAPRVETPKQSRLQGNAGQQLASAWLAPLALSGALFAEDEPKKDEPAKEGNPYLAKPNQTSTQLTDWVLRMLDKPKTIQGRPGFATAVAEACDRILADKSAKETEQLVAIENKLAILHKAACAGDDALDKQLVVFVAQLKDDSRPRVARETAFFLQERKVLDASDKKPEEIAALLKEMQDYYAKEKLASKHLRMASATVDLVNKLEDGDAREKHFTDLGNLFAKSSDKELARYGKKLAKKPETKESDLIGKPLELAGDLADGNPFAWEKYRGKVVVVDFWATWCGPCRKEMPNVKAFLDKHKDKGFEVVGVSVDKDLEALETFLDENDLPWETLAGEEAQAAAEKYGVRAIPTMMLIDQKGNVVAVAHNIAALAPEAEKLLAAAKAK